ncbi:MAG TPA: response regulator [Thermoanaerobaculia bacterium]|jgi:CheY-like chemotaxis protein
MNRTEKPRVLLVDDNEATCTLVTALLQREFAVETAFDGQEALERLRTKMYAAILLDLRMPQPDGYAILDFISTTRPEVMKSVIVVSAALSPREIERLRQYDVCAIIAKPFEIESLLQSVKDCANVNDTPALGPGNLISGSMILLISEWLLRRL